MSLTVTDQAAAALSQYLESQAREEEQVLRLIADGEGNHRFTLDTPNPGDQVVEHNGEAVMVIEPEISEDLADNVLDLKETSSGISLTLSK